MSRLSPITVGMSILAVVVLGISVYLVVRSRRAVETASVHDQPEEVVSSVGATALRAVTVDGAHEPESLRAPPPLSVAEPPAAGDGHDGMRDGHDATETAIRKRGFLLAIHDQKLMQEADERAFEVLKIPEITRAAIRRINDDYQTKIQAWSSEQSGTGDVTNSGAERAREDAINELLGADSADRFDTAERAGVRRLRGQYRWERARLLRE